MANGPRSTKEIITDFFAGLDKVQTVDPEDLMKDFADDGIWWAAGTVSASGDASKAVMIERLKGLRQTSDAGFKITPTSWIIDGDRAAVEAKSYLPFKDGKVYQNEYHFVIVVRDGKIQHVKEYMDTAHVAELFG